MINKHKSQNYSVSGTLKKGQPEIGPIRMKKLLLWLLSPIFIFAMNNPNHQKLDLDFDRGLDSFLVVDPFNPIEKTKIGLNSYLMTPCGLSYAMISPSMNVYFNGNFDTSLGIGLRRPFTNFILGIHAFLDYSFQRPIPFYQFGNSFELLNNDFDLRINYYNPIFPSTIYKKSGFLPERWIECEYTAKFKNFFIGFGPIYNFTKDKWAFKPKIVIPLNLFTIEAGVYLSENSHEHTSYFSLGVPLYSMGQNPVARSCSVRSSQGSGIGLLEKQAVKKKLL